MEDSQQKVVQFSGEEFLKVGEIAKPFWERGASGNPPKIVIFMGGVGAGKTTIRREQFANDYVHFDFGEIFNAVKKSFEKDDPKLVSYVSLACDLILKESINAKKNIVIEIIGETAEPITAVIDNMKKIGYEVSVNGITCDIAEAYKRHIKAVQEDPDYLSAAHTQEATLSFFYNYFDLGPVPIAPMA